MRVLLTGGSGFIGRNIVESYLSEKYQIISPSRAQLDCADDMSVENFFMKKNFDVVIHSATKPGHRNSADPHDIFFPNSRMTFNLLKYKDSWGKLINMGSGAIYDMAHYLPKMKEEYFGTHIPTDQHGYNKYLGGLLFPHFDHAVDFRIFGIFGKYEDYAIRFISNAICKALCGLPITLRQNRKFDYLYVNDLIPILDFFITHDSPHSEYNITPDHSIDLVDLAKLIKVINGDKCEILVSAEGTGMEYSGDNTRLKNFYPDVRFTSVENAIAQLYAWYKNNLHLINREALRIDK